MQQRCSRWVKKRKKKKNEKMINVDEKSTKNVKIKRIIEKEFSKEKKNFDTMIFEIVDVKDSNAKTFIKYYINDTTTISNCFTKIFFEFKNFLKKESTTQMHEKEQKRKKIRKRTKTKTLKRRKRRKQMYNATMIMDTWRQAISINVFWHCRVFTFRTLFRESYDLMLLKSAVLHNSSLNAFRTLM